MNVKEADYKNTFIKPDLTNILHSGLLSHLFSRSKLNFVDSLLCILCTKWKHAGENVSVSMFHLRNYWMNEMCQMECILNTVARTKFWFVSAEYSLTLHEDQSDNTVDFLCNRSSYIKMAHGTRYTSSVIKTYIFKFKLFFNDDFIEIQEKQFLLYAACFVERD